MNNPVALLDQVVSDLDRVLGADGLGSLSDAERMDVLRVAGDAFRRIEAVVVETTAGAEPGFADQFGCRSMNELLQRVLRVDSPGAARVVKAADLVHQDVELTSGAPLPARWPALREAMRDGTIGIAGLLAATGPIDRAGVRIGLTDRLRADAELAHQARGYVLADADSADADAAPRVPELVEGPGPDAAPPATPEDLKQFAQLVAMYLDPDGSAPSAAEASQGRSFTVGRLRNGTYPVRGNLLPEVYAQLQLLFDAQLNPKTAGPTDLGVVFRPSDEIDSNGDPFNDDPRNVIDQRTRPQKQHDALATALGIAARHDEMPSLGG
ncbi:DUF222 domain-containing protein, partial [Microbacterium aurantiacum]|uniref:DUF222 domain-containing protein n=1 Tax=Microbacterium aurantiacum TaxID=162393 RepID=UPI0011AF9C35